MHTPTPSSASNSSSSQGLNASLAETPSSPMSEAESLPPPVEQAEPGVSNLDQALATLGEHKGKLAIGAAATLGLMVFYKWREKQLAEEDPQEYERLQRIKNRMRRADDYPDDRDSA